MLIFGISNKGTNQAITSSSCNLGFKANIRHQASKAHYIFIIVLSRLYQVWFDISLIDIKKNVIENDTVPTREDNYKLLTSEAQSSGNTHEAEERGGSGASLVGYSGHCTMNICFRGVE